MSCGTTWANKNHDDIMRFIWIYVADRLLKLQNRTGRKLHEDTFKRCIFFNFSLSGFFLNSHLLPHIHNNVSSNVNNAFHQFRASMLFAMNTTSPHTGNSRLLKVTNLSLVLQNDINVFAHCICRCAVTINAIYKFIIQSTIPSDSKTPAHVIK